MIIKLYPILRENPRVITTLTHLWNVSCGPEFTVTEAFLRYNLRPTTGGLQEGRIVYHGQTPVGFVLASALPEVPETLYPVTPGWIDALVVAPEAQYKGFGTQLLLWAEAWLAAQEVERIFVAGSLRSFMPGVPESFSHTRRFFTNHGYTVEGRSWDVARDLGEGPSFRRYPPQELAPIRPATPDDLEALRDFFARAFPGRWRFEVEEFLREGGRIADILILEQDERVEGFCWITREDSLRPLDRFYMHRLPKPWGQLGPIGVSESVRGQGWGGRLLQAGLTHLADHGVRGCVIDWTELLDFYGKFGFEPYHCYHMMTKQLKMTNDKMENGE
ncbi:MAG: GNAT family N-acetyltransferase [Anaerolineae bacterium]